MATSVTAIVTSYILARQRVHEKLRCTETF